MQALSLNIPSCGDGATVDYPGKGQAVLGARHLEHYALPSLPPQLALPSQCPHTFYVCVVLKVQAPLQRPGLGASCLR